ncbi:MAG: polysaccharide deacetylase family protein [Bacillota bacterium]|nr:polysaccharide deacetylase family protein [Bacillota bacterium]
MLLVTITRRGRRRLILAGILIVAMMATGYLVSARRHLLVSGRLMPVYRAVTREKRVALTFDISWGQEMPPRVLDALKAEGVRATFFLSGPWARSYPDLVKRIAGEGHEIASHGYEHVNLSGYSREFITDNIRRTHQILVELTGQQPRFFRPPNGDFNDLVIQTATELGYVTVIWSLDSLDWKRLNSDEIAKRILSRVKQGDIILMHASDSAPGTPGALPAIVQGIRAKGLEMVRLGELMQPPPPLDTSTGSGR